MLERVVFDLDANLDDELNKAVWWMKSNQDKVNTHQVVLLRMLEGEVHFHIKDHFLFRIKDEVLPLWPKNNIALVMSDVYLEKNIQDWFSLRNPMTVVSYPLSLLARTRNYMNDKSIVQPKRHNKLSKKFICLNAAAKKHRSELVTELYYRGHAKDGFISWLNRYGSLKQKYFNRPQMFSGQTAILDFSGENIDKGQTQEILPSQYWYCGFDIVQESIVSDTSLFVTEKTWKPILFEKIFIPHGCRGTMAWLIKQGFEPYTELYDNSFDNLIYVERFKVLMGQISNLMNYTVEDWISIYEDRNIKEKLRHNRELFRHMSILGWQERLDELNRQRQAT